MHTSNHTLADNKSPSFMRDVGAQDTKAQDMICLLFEPALHNNTCTCCTQKRPK